MWCFAQLWQIPEHKPAGHLPHRELTGQRRYGSSRTSASFLAGGNPLIPKTSRVPGFPTAQRRPALPQPLPCLLVLRPARRPIQPFSEATQPHLLLRRVHGLLRLQREPAPRPLLPLAFTREPAHQETLSQVTRRAAPRVLGLRVALYSEYFPLLCLPAMQ